MAEVPDDETLAFARRLFDLAREGRADELGAYLDAGVPANMTDEKGDTLLMLAAYAPAPGAVRVLLEHGADTSRINDRGQTALGAAVFRQSAEAVRALLDHGADPALGSPSAAEVARFFELPAMVELLGDTGPASPP